MTVKDTTILKGVAILFMLYLHLFNQQENVDLCQTYLTLDGEALIYLLTRCTHPVSFFILLSGYGLYASYKKGKQGIMRRIKKLYIHYWLSLLLFIPLGAFVVGTQVYPGDVYNVIGNLTGWSTSYNGELWFLFPYVLVSSSSVLIFRMMDKLKFLLAFLLAGIVYFMSYLTISLYGASYLYTHLWAYMPVLYASFLFPFVLGGMMKKYDVVEKVRFFRGEILDNHYINSCSAAVYRNRYF